MFGKKKHLLREGASAQAVVVDAERHGGQIGADGATPVSYRLQVRVHPEGGTPFDAVATVGGAMHSARGIYVPGDIVPVRFDPDHPETVLVDEAVLLAAREDRRRADAEAAVVRAEQRLAGLPGPVAGDPRDLPTDDALRAAHERWKTAKARAKEAKAEHKRAEAGGDKRETLRAFNTSVKRAAEEKTARERYTELHKSRPDWVPDGG